MDKNWKLSLVLDHPGMNNVEKAEAIVSLVLDEIEGAGFSVSEKNWLSLNGSLFGKKFSFGGSLITSAAGKKYGKLGRMSGKKRPAGNQETPADAKKEEEA